MYFKKGKVKVVRMSPGLHVDGVYVDGADESFYISDRMQPLTEKELLNLPEGQRTKNTKKIYTSKKLRTVNTKMKIKPDILIDEDDVQYQVQKNVDYTILTNHYKAILVEVND